VSARANLEVRFRWVSVTSVALFAIALVAGMVLHIVSPGSPVSVGVLRAGLVALMAAPGVRIAIAVAERVRRRDWSFVLMTMVVVIELAIVLWRASSKA